MQNASSPAALFVFAHQDDEVAAASRIAFELERGSAVYCAFLTDGGATTPAGVRDAESRAALTARGVDRERILFIGSDETIPGGRLVHYLDRALAALESGLRDTVVGTVYCLAWEGGNHDHDASHLVAAAFARRRRILDRSFELPLYRAAVGPLFRVLSPLPGSGGWQQRHLTLREGITLSRIAWSYPSQRRTWVGLFPELFMKLVILRRERIRPVELSRVRRRPHEGQLLYERRRRFTYREFATAAAPFLGAHLSPQPSGDDGAEKS